MVISLRMVTLSYTCHTKIIKFAHKFSENQRHLKRLISSNTENKVLKTWNICRFNECQNKPYFKNIMMFSKEINKLFESFEYSNSSFIIYNVLDMNRCFNFVYSNLAI